MPQQEVPPNEFTARNTSSYFIAGLAFLGMVVGRMVGLTFKESVVVGGAALIYLPTVSFIYSFIRWRPFFTRWPAHPLDSDAQTRKREMILGFPSRLGVDSYGVHVSAHPLARLFGARPFSIPWSDIQWCARSRWDRFWNDRKLQAGGERILRLPDWVYHHTPSSVQHLSEPE